MSKDLIIYGKVAQPRLTLRSTCYNHATYLVAALESVKAQQFNQFQWIITDDKSQDNSPELIQAWLDNNREWIQGNEVEVIFIAHTVNYGLCKSLNEQLSYVTSPYLTGLSLDDQMLPGRLEAQLQAIEASSEDTMLLYGDVLKIDDNGKSLQSTIWEELGLTYQTVPRGRVYAELLEKNFIPAPATIVKMQAFRELGGYDERLIYEDYDFFLRIAYRYTIYPLNFVCTAYRVHAASMFSSRGTKYLRSQLQILLKQPDAAQNSGIKARIVSKTGEYYYHNNRIESDLAFQALRKTRHPRLLAFWLFSLFKLSYASLLRLNKLARFK